jgi:membrane fusion protein (multidrug efflux system)
LLPPENATGNFTKIVQRVPIRIAVPASESQGRLRPGLSVVVDIDTRTAPKADAQQTASRAQ